VLPVSAAGQQATRNRAADIEAVRAVGREWRAHYSAGRFEAIPELYTADTMVMPRGRPRIAGREAMRRAIGGLAAGRSVDIDVTEREIVVNGDIAWFIGDFRVTYTSPDAATPSRTEFGRSLILFRRDADGRWRVHRDIDSPAPPPAGSAAQAAPAPVQLKASTAAGPAQPSGSAASSAAAAVQPSRPGAGAAVPRMWDPASRTTPTQCDRLTASRYDRTRLAPPVAPEDMDVPAAIRQCEADLARFPGDPRIHFQLGRVYSYAGDRAKTLEHRRAAAAAGNHNAIFLLAYLAWAGSTDTQVRCEAARDMRLAADRGNYSAQVTYASFFLENRFSACSDVASREQVAGYLRSARPAVDGFFETRLVEHLAFELERADAASPDRNSGQS